jgi:hypothetical protein
MKSCGLRSKRLPGGSTADSRGLTDTGNRPEKRGHVRLGVGPISVS